MQNEGKPNIYIPKTDDIPKTSSSPKGAKKNGKNTIVRPQSGMKKK